MSILSAFNNVIINFIEDCILVFPEENDFKIYKKGLQVYQKYNPKKILTIFNEYMGLYRDKIPSLFLHFAFVRFLLPPRW